MTSKKQNLKSASHSIEPGHPDYRQGNTGIPQQEVYDEGEKKLDEDVQAEKQHEQPKQETDDEERKIVNEQEEDQVVNNDEGATQTSSQPEEKPKMSDKPDQAVNPQQR